MSAPDEFIVVGWQRAQSASEVTPACAVVAGGMAWQEPQLAPPLPGTQVGVASP